MVSGGLQTQVLLAGGVEVAQEQADIVPSPVGDLFRVPGVGGVSSTRPDGRRRGRPGLGSRSVIVTVISELAPPPG